MKPRRLTIALTALASCAVGVGLWVTVRPKALLVAPQAVPMPPSQPKPAPAQPVVPRGLALASEPSPPSPGTPARDIYFRAMIAGDERGIAVAREALFEAQGGSGHPDPGYVRTLEKMEKAYAERLERHRAAMSSGVVSSDVRGR